jgi:predicted MFS family arabinose efflux permease
VGYDPEKLSSIFPAVLYVLIIGSILFFVLLMVGAKYADTSYLDDIQSKTLPVHHQFRLIFAPVIVLPLVLLLMVNFLHGSGAGATLPYLPNYLKSLGADPFDLSLLVLALNLFMAIATQLTVPLSKKIGELKLFGLATFLSTVALVALVYADDLNMAATFFIIRGTFANMTAPIGQARVLSYIDSQVRATGAALSTNIRWVGWTIFSPISGNIIDNYGYQASFVFTAFLYLIATALFIWVNATKPSLDAIRAQESAG